MNTNRREFLKKTSTLTAGIGLSSVISAKTVQSVFPNSSTQKVNLGVIGVGMGCRDLQGALTDNPWVHCLGLCDVNQQRLEEQAARFKTEFPDQTSKMMLYKDFRKLLENKDIDGVIIATPDHWHSYMFAEALKAGKAVYVEKPVANSIEECNLLIDLQKKYQNIVTTGLWQTSQRYFLKAYEILKSGVLGDVYKVQLWINEPTNPIAKVTDTSAPEYIDYDMWLGPAPKRFFNNHRYWSWRTFWDYGGGQQTDWGVHWIDSAFDGLKALGLCDRSYPEAVFSSAYKHPESFNETPSCQTTIFQYKNFHIEWTQQVAQLYNRTQGVAWIGSKATLVCNREGYELIPEKDRDGNPMVEAILLRGKYEEGGIEAHASNWCRCIREQTKKTNSPVEKGVFATILAHLGNISYRSASCVSYDPLTRNIVDNPKASNFIKVKYREPWKIPIV
jgi:predicted dehydrogenase